VNLVYNRSETYLLVMYKYCSNLIITDMAMLGNFEVISNRLNIVNVHVINQNYSLS
jgi:hypothetical protein